MGILGPVWQKGFLVKIFVSETPSREKCRNQEAPLVRALLENDPFVISMGKKSGRRACRRGNFRRFFRFLLSAGMWSVFLLDWGLAGTGVWLELGH